MLADWPLAPDDPLTVQGLQLLREALAGGAPALLLSTLRSEHTALFVGLEHVAAPPWESVYLSREACLTSRRWPCASFTHALTCKSQKSTVSRMAAHIGFERCSWRTCWNKPPAWRQAASPKGRRPACRQPRSSCKRIRSSGPISLQAASWHRRRPPIIGAGPVCSWAACKGWRRCSRMRQPQPLHRKLMEPPHESAPAAGRWNRCSPLALPFTWTPTAAVRHWHREHACRLCVDGCPVQALTVTAAGVALDAETCVECGYCLHACPTGALAGRDETAKLWQAAALPSGAVIDLTCGHFPAVQAEPDVTAIVEVGGCLAALGAAAYVGLGALGVAEASVHVEACGDSRLVRYTGQLRTAWPLPEY